MSQPDEIEDSPAEAFVAALRYGRDVRSYSQSALAGAVGYGPSYVSKVESSQQRPSRTLAESADQVLNTGGSLVQALDALDRPRPNVHAVRRDTGQTPVVDASAPSLMVEQDEAELVYDGQTYRPRQRRLLYNASDVPATRYLIRISVDRHPGDPERSNLLYREDPLTWDELALVSTHDGHNPMHWTCATAGTRSRSCGCALRTSTAGSRSTRASGSGSSTATRSVTGSGPTGSSGPCASRPSTWPWPGLPGRPRAGRVGHRDDHDRRVVPVPDRHRPPRRGRPGSVQLVNARAAAARPLPPWSGASKPAGQSGQGPLAHRDHADLGILQEGEPILGETARPFDLPAEAEDARRAIAQRSSAMSRVEAVHVFGKGMGIAAPRVGIGRAQPWSARRPARQSPSAPSP
jgi:transcriptional regulator with XRE-family HTH domain